MARFTYNASITERTYPLWEAYLERISDAEAAKIAGIVELPGSGEIPTQGAYDSLMQGTAGYYNKIK